MTVWQTIAGWCKKQDINALEQRIGKAEQALATIAQTVASIEQLVAELKTLNLGDRTTALENLQPAIQESLTTALGQAKAAQTNLAAAHTRSLEEIKAAHEQSLDNLKARSTHVDALEQRIGALEESVKIQ